MRLLLFLLLITSFSIVTEAQITDEEAKQLYQEAEEQFEEGNFYQSNVLVGRLITKMGKPTPKTLYLKIKAIYNNLENPQDKSELRLRKSFDNYAKYVGYCEDFFAIIDKNNYPIEKFNEILSIKQNFEQGVKQFEHEKDRKPEDALAFLNECAEKFPKKLLSSPVLPNIKFSVDSTKLKIEVFGQDDYTEKPRFRQVHRGLLIIDLSKVWLTYREAKVSNFIIERSLFNYPYSSNDLIDVNGPVITSNSNHNGNTEIFDNIYFFQDSKFDKNRSYPDNEFQTKVKLQKTNYPFYLFALFDQTSEEFRKGNHRQRIYDAFDFLIKYYGGGEPIQNSTERKTKF